MSKYISYIRVSTDEQGRSGLGLEAQRQLVSDYLNGQQVLEEYKEIASGKKIDREKLLSAIAHAKATGSTLLFAKLDRAGRRASQVLGILDNSGVKVEFADCPNASSLELGLRAIIAQEEGTATSERTKRALAVKRAELAKEGERLGCPNGAAALRRYEAIHGNVAATEGARKAADTFASETRQWIENALAAGCGSASAIAAHLNQGGFLTRRGAAWNHVQVKRTMDRLELAVA